MSNTINADDGIISGIAGLKYSADTSGALVLQTNGTTAITISASQVVTFAGAVSLGALTTSGNLTFTGSGNRILGDFSNATVANRVFAQSSTTNGLTAFGVIPNGTSTQSQFNAYNAADPTNANSITILALATEARLASGTNGTATANPLTMYTGGSERLRIDTSGNVGIGTSAQTTRLSFGAYIPANGQTISIFESGNTKTGLGVVASVFRIYTDSTAAMTFGRVSTADGSTYTEQMRLDTVGNLGIGITTPASYTGGSNGLAVSVTGNSGMGMFRNHQTTGITYDQIQIGVAQGASSAYNFIRAYHSVDTTPTVQFAVDGTGSGYFAGNVSLGNSGSSSSTGTPNTLGLGGTFSSTAGANAKIRVWQDTSVSQYMGIGVSSNQLDYICTGGYSHVWYSNSSERMRLDASGNLLIGTSTTPSGISNSLTFVDNTYQKSANITNGSIFEYNANTTLPATVWGRLVTSNTTNATTLTLPSLSGQAGKVISISNINTGPVTVVTGASNGAIFGMGVNGGTTIYVPAYSHIQLANDGGNWKALTSNTIVPTTGTAPYLGARAYVYFSASGGSVSGVTGYNVSSVSRTGVGVFQVNYTTALSSGNYSNLAVTGTGSPGSGDNAGGIRMYQGTTTYGYFATGTSGFSAFQDNAYNSFVAFA